MRPSPQPSPSGRGGPHAHDHEHDHEGGAVPHTHLTSVGIDIGSSTSHLMFSQLTVGYPSWHQRQPQVLERRVISRSPVTLTPFSADWRLDVEPLRKLVGEAFTQAGLRPDEVDTGAVIVTGEAARRDNASRIVELFSDETGRFVCATAGPRLEALLAAHGSGAVSLSRDTGFPLLHVDVGGGTTKVSVVERGRVLDVMALNIGARLLAFDDAGRLQRLETAGRRFLEAIGSRVELGAAVELSVRERLAHEMARTLFSTIGGDGHADWLMVTAPLRRAPSFEGILFSGGVSEYVYGREAAEYGDLGPLLGRELARLVAERGYRLLDSAEGIRATVIGASEYSIQLSGETIFIPDPSALPMRNLRVTTLHVTWEAPVADQAEQAVREALAARDPEVRDDPFAVAVSSPPFWGYGVAQDLAEGIRRAIVPLPHGERPALLVFEQNVGQVIGSTLAAELRLPCIDEVSLSELDFIDVGEPVAGESYVPVVVKSLAFGA